MKERKKNECIKGFLCMYQWELFARERLLWHLRMCDNYTGVRRDVGKKCGKENKKKTLKIPFVIDF